MARLNSSANSSNHAGANSLRRSEEFKAANAQRMAAREKPNAKQAAMERSARYAQDFKARMAQQNQQAGR